MTMRPSRISLSLAPLLVLTSVVASGADEETTSALSTWEISHPELRGIFGSPFTAEGRAHRARSFVPWPYTIHETTFPAIQPTVAIGANDALFAHGYSVKGWNLGRVIHSADGGRNWAAIGSVVDMRIKVPEGQKLLRAGGNGIGVTRAGTLLYYFSVQYHDGRKRSAGVEDTSLRIDAYVTRSTDRGKTWAPPVRINATSRDQTGAQVARCVQLTGGRVGLVLGSWDAIEPGGQLKPWAIYAMRTYLYTSEDDGKSWTRGARPICEHGVEPDLLVLPSGRLLLAIRYQRPKLEGDPPELASPHLLRDDAPPYTKSKQLHRGLVARLTAILYSDDGGVSWTEPRLVTGFDEQTASLVRLSDGTVILPFGYKTDTRGQRFMVSYDEGETWSRTVFQLHKDGQYASSVVLADDTIVTTIHGTETLSLQALRWRAPPRERVAAGGFWTPRPVEPLGVRR